MSQIESSLQENKCSVHYKCVRFNESCNIRKQKICKLRLEVFEANCQVMIKGEENKKNINPDSLRCNIIPIRLFFHEMGLNCECNGVCIPTSFSGTEKILRPYWQANSYMRVKKEEYPALKKILIKHFYSLIGEQYHGEEKRKALQTF